MSRFYRRLFAILSICGVFAGMPLVFLFIRWLYGATSRDSYEACVVAGSMIGLFAGIFLAVCIGDEL